MSKEKKEQLKNAEAAGMHELKNKKMPHVAVNKRRGKILTNKKKRRALKIVAAVSAVVIMFVGVFAVAAFGAGTNRNDVDAGFVTVSKEIPVDGSKPTDHSALDNIAYMNYVFHRQTNWYSETHGTTVAAGISQSVNTWKQYDDEILIMADITYSSLVNQARQICYVGDEVLWREAASTKYDGLNTVWSDKLKGHLKLDEFVKQNGLPGTEFCVYIINEETLLSADDVKDNGDGTYSQTYYLDPARDKAPAHYINQMIFTGGIKDADFNYITVTYTFDEKWQVVAADVDESYYASMGFSVTCNSNFHVFYEYGTDKAYSDAYGTYFSQYAGTDIAEGGAVVSDPTAMGCLGEAFGGVMAGPSVLDLTLTLNGKRIDGKIYLDISDMQKLDVRAKLGSLGVWYVGNRVYLSVAGTNVCMSVDELMGLVNGFLPEDTEEKGEEETDLLSSIFLLSDDGFVFDETSAHLSALLSLKALGINLEIPVEFAFGLERQTDAQNRVSYKVTLQDVQTEIALADITVGAKLAFGEGEIPALTESERATFIDVMPYVNSLVELFSGEALRAEIVFEQGDAAIAGELNISLKDFTVAGNLTVSYAGTAVDVALAFADGNLYLEACGLKVKANVSDVLAFVSEFIDLPEAQQISLSAMLEKVLSLDFASLVHVSEENGALTVSAAGTELLKALLGKDDFALGEVTLGVSEEGIFASALGANVNLCKGKAFELSLDGYADLAELFPYVKALANIFSSDLLRVQLAYGEEGGVRLAGDLLLSLKNGFAASGSLTLTLPAEEDVTFAAAFVYAGGKVYLDVADAKIVLNPQEAVSFLSQYLGGGSFDATALLDKVLSPEFFEYFTLSAQSKLQLTVRGTELLRYLGLGDFELGNVQLEVEGQELTVGALGVTATVTGEQGEIVLPTGDYRDATALIGEILKIAEEKELSFRGQIGLNANGTEIALAVHGANVSWKNGIYAMINATLYAGGTAHDLAIEATDAGLKIAYGNVGVELIYDDLGRLETALTELYNEIAERINAASEGGDVLAAADSLEGILSSLKGLLALFTAGEEIVDGGFSVAEIDWGNLLTAISLANPEEGIVTLSLGWAELTLSCEEKIALTLGCALDETFVLADLVLDGTAVQMPAVSYLGTEELCELLGFVNSAVQTLFADTLSATVEGTTYAFDKASYPDGIINTFTAQIEYYSGAAKTPVHFDIAGKNFYVNTDLYLNLSLALDNRAQGKDDMYLDVWVLDWEQKDGREVKDDVLDLYVSLSRVGSGDGKLCLHMTANELATLSASALALLGADVDFLNDLLINSYLDIETADALRTVGERLKKSLDFDGLLQKLFPVSEESGAPAPQDEESLRGYLKALAVSGGKLELKLDSALVFGKTGLEDLSFSLTKGDEGITGVALGNVYAEGGDRTDVRVTASYETYNRSTPIVSGAYYELAGIAELLGSITKSATHYNKNGKAELNDYFYVDGTISISVPLMTIPDVPLRVSVKVEEDGNVSANLYVKLPAIKKFGYTLIDGDTETYFSLDKGMIYIRRVVTTDASGNALKQPETLYRAMPLSVFGADAMHQIGFMFNLGADIVTAMEGSDMSIDTSGDYGTVAKSLISSCVYTPSANGNKWEMKINGKTFLDVGLASLGDIAVTINTDKEGVVRTLDLGTQLTVFGIINLKVDGTLTYQNPRDEVAVDKTENVAGELASAMSKAIREANAAKWKDADGADYFVEGKIAEISYLVGINEVGKQRVVYNTATNELLADLVPPAADGFALEGYQIVWNLPADNKLPTSLNIYGKTEAKRFTVILESEKPLTGFVKNGNGLYEITLTYVYGDGLYTKDGDKYLFPDGETNGERVRAFVSGAFEFTNFDDCTNILSDLRLTADWERVEYTVTYLANGETVEVQTAYFGESYLLPAVQKTGYDFLGWLDEAGNEVQGTVSGNVTLTAKLQAKTFTVTLISENAAESVFELADGAYRKTFEYTYGTQLTLPTGEYGDLFLKGYLGDNGTLYTQIENILESVTLRAVWTNISVIVTFVDEDGNTVATLNCEKGDRMGDYTLPAVPAKAGHTGAWNVTADTEIAVGLTVAPVYTANAYTVTIVSQTPVAGFKPIALTALYGETVSLPDGLKIAKYDFGGIYNGAGERVTSVTVWEDTTLYLNWIDNTVTVTLLGEAPFEGATWNGALSAYATTLTFNDEYTLSFAPAAQGYQQLGGWWYQVGDTWEQVTNVRALDGARLWSVWVEDFHVTVTDFYTSSFLGGKRYTVGGTLTGGRIKGAMGENIFAAVGSGETLQAQCVIWGSKASLGYSDGVLDAPGSGKVEALSYVDGVATFRREKMESLAYSGFAGAPVAEYGGVKISKTFSLKNGGSVDVKTLTLVTLESYTVTVKDSFGNVINTITEHHYASEITVRDSSKNTYNVTCETVVLGDLLSSVNVPAVAGYEFVGWDKDLNTQVGRGASLTVTAQYQAI